MNPNYRNFALWVIIVMLLLALFTMFQNPGQRSGTNEISFSQLLGDVDKSASTGIETAELADIDVTGRVELRERQCRELAIAAIDEIELRETIEQGLRMTVRGELPIAHDETTERAMLGREGVVRDLSIVEDALLRHHQRRI